MKKISEIKTEEAVNIVAFLIITSIVVFLIGVEIPVILFLTFWLNDKFGETIIEKVNANKETKQNDETKED